MWTFLFYGVIILNESWWIMNKIKLILVIIVAISGAILAILFFQDRTKKLEDRDYKDIKKITVETDKANINFYKSDDEKVRVVVYGSSKDTVKIIEGSQELSISKETGNTTCFLNCKNQVNIYVPEDFPFILVKSEIGNINSKVKLVSSDINSDKGNIDLYKVNIVNINSNIGNILIDEINGTYNSTIKTDIGNVTIKKIVNLFINAKSEVGSVVIPVIKDSQEFTLTVETNKGNIGIDHHESKSE